MKSLAQRLKEKAERDAKEAIKAKLKRSDLIKSFSIKIPWCGCPFIVIEGDMIYIKKRAKKVIDLIQSRAAWQFFDEMKKYIDEVEKSQKKAYTNYSPLTGGVDPSPVTPATAPATPTTPSEGVALVEPVATTSPAQPIESPGVSVREVDITTATEARESILGPVPHLPELTEEDYEGEENLFEVPARTDG
jgi:hypothetical protein